MHWMVPRRIKDYLREHKISEDSLAIKIGCSQSNINHVLRQDDMRLSMLLKICEALVVPPALFLSAEAIEENREIGLLKVSIKKIEERISALERPSE